MAQDANKVSYSMAPRERPAGNGEDRNKRLEGKFPEFRAPSQEND